MRMERTSKIMKCCDSPWLLFLYLFLQESQSSSLKFGVRFTYLFWFSTSGSWPTEYTECMANGFEYREPC